VPTCAVDSISTTRARGKACATESQGTVLVDLNCEKLKYGGKLVTLPKFECLLPVLVPD
jgi:hypothetical protein